MKLRNFTLMGLMFLSLTTFAQNITRNLKLETKNAYLDSIKTTFVHDNIASCVDSLWMKELTNLDLYNDLSVDIKTINVDQKVDYELSTELLKERLAAMDAKSPFNIEYNQGLENVIKSFLKNRKKSFERLMAISEYYFPIFEEAMARQNVPLEIKYLAVVESALNPKAVSRVGATGLWQFMYQTGKQYNLNISTYVDERSDPLKASDAAAQYMSNMYKIFGDWDLVLASYNSGPGNVAKAIRRSGGLQNYWNIRKNLPKETQGYVPAFLATMYIYEYHKEHGIVPNRAIIKHFATDTVMVKQQISFKQISDLLCIPVSQLQLLNPSYKRDVIPYIAGQNNFLRLPNDKIAIYTSNEEKIYAYVQYEESLREKTFTRVFERAIVSRDSINTNADSATSSGIQYYQVKRGDNLSDIAGQYGVAMSDIKKWNKLKSNKVALGKNLKIYTSEIKTTEQPANSDIASAEAKDGKSESTFKEVKVVSFVKTTKTYKVKKGDNLGEIAEKYDVSVADIKKWNKLKSNNVALGKSLKIMTSERVVKVKKEIKTEKTATEGKVESIASSEEKDGKEAKPEFYVVQKGDNLGTIAKKHNVTIAEIKEWNNLPDANIQLESRLKVSKAALENGEPVAQVEPEFKTQEYVVVKGDNLGNIAKKYNVTPAELKEWNNLADHNIQLGSKLIVSKKEIKASKSPDKKDKLASASKSKRDLYYVRKGDSLFSIAKKYPGVTISDLKKWNRISNENLKPGMKLKING